MGSLCSADNRGKVSVDEIAYGKGHEYLTLVYQIEAGCTRLLWVGEKRTKEAFQTLLPPGSAAVTLLDHLPGWRRLHTDKVAVVHVKTQGDQINTPGLAAPSQPDANSRLIE